MTHEEAHQAVAKHIEHEVRKLAAEMSLDEEGAMRIALQIYEHPSFHLWRDMQIARLAGAVH